MNPSSNHGISRPTQRALASAGAVSLVMASLSAMPASFANEQQPAPHDNSSGCRNIAITADRYQGLPGEYQLAYSDYTRNLYTTFSNGRRPFTPAALECGQPTAKSQPSMKLCCREP